jgi:hypothetical protein
MISSGVCDACGTVESFRLRAGMDPVRFLLAAKCSGCGTRSLRDRSAVDPHERPTLRELPEAAP